MTASRKSRFDLELANWETQKLEHQLELVQKQWEENGMEELVREELNSRGVSGTRTTRATPTTPLQIV